MNEPPRFAAFLWEGYVLHVSGPIGLPRHVHSAVELVLGFDEPVIVETDDGGSVRGQCVAIGSNVPHTFVGQDHATLWIEPHSDAGRRLTAQVLGDGPAAVVELPDLGDLAARGTALLADPTCCDTAWALAQDWLAGATQSLPPGRVVHPAIHEALRIIRSRPQFKISAKELADAVELSEGRLMDLFREHMGMPLRRFLMWQRVGEAAVRLAQGMPATEVAYEVGFADAAHLTRTLKRMLGIRPSDLLRFPPTRLHVCPPPG